MKLIYTRINNIKPEIVRRFAQKEIKNEKKLIQHASGRCLLDYGLKHFYDINSYDIKIDKKGKPYINSDINFSISHSKDIVLVGFSKDFIGVDIEFMKKRDFKSILEHYNITKELSKIEFYQLWTDYEARYKSGLSDSVSFKLGDYIFSVSSNNTQLEIYEAAIPTDKSIPSELISLKLVKDSKKNENTVDKHAANTAISDCLPPLDLKIE